MLRRFIVNFSFKFTAEHAEIVSSSALSAASAVKMLFYEIRLFQAFSVSRLVLPASAQGTSGVPVQRRQSPRVPGNPDRSIPAGWENARGYIQGNAYEKTL